jgi:pimeloyl-ACP methyl ester carboxylesterase
MPLRVTSATRSALGGDGKSGAMDFFPFPNVFNAAADYAMDATQRGALFLDILRERGNTYLEHRKSGKPPVLVFDYEMVMDGRELEDPCNYALVRILPPAECPPTDPTRRPFVVIDPRAGHGPGIGGFKMDSEIGIALKNGHPCYFIMFFPRPMKGQTIESITRAEVAFLLKVNQLHGDAVGKPFVIGNCQGGWAVAIVASVAPSLVGPMLLAGTPLAYWSGVKGKHPLRYLGGLLGGTWMASLASDIGDGYFDGSHLVNNFEQLNPANSYWGKLYHVFANADNERERFLEFEKWWGGHYLLNKEEIEWITQNLFVGNRLASGEVHSKDGSVRVDLRNIRSPIIVFASWGDNITPPQQALNWILDIYDSIDDIRLNEQTIVYCLHEKIGHLGIFVSSQVAEREHGEIFTALDQIDSLPPGLYEAVISDTKPGMPGLVLAAERYMIHFEPRDLDAIRALDDGREDERAFEVVRRVARINQGYYDNFVSPWVRAFSTKESGTHSRNLTPARLERRLFSDLNPMMWPVKTAAKAARALRKPVGENNPFAAAERGASQIIEHSLESFTRLRDQFAESLFEGIYQSPFMRLSVGINPKRRRGVTRDTWEHRELKRLKRKDIERQIDSGTPLDGWGRILIFVCWHEDVADERDFRMLQEIVGEMPPERRPTLAVIKQTAKRQAFALQFDSVRAIAALPHLLPSKEDRVKAYLGTKRVAEARGLLTERQVERLSVVADALGLDEAELARKADRMSGRRANAAKAATVKQTSGKSRKPRSAAQTKSAAPKSKSKSKSKSASTAKTVKTRKRT